MKNVLSMSVAGSVVVVVAVALVFAVLFTLAILYKNGKVLLGKDDGKVEKRLQKSYAKAKEDNYSLNKTVHFYGQKRKLRVWQGVLCGICVLIAAFFVFAVVSMSIFRFQNGQLYFSDSAWVTVQTDDMQSTVPNGAMVTVKEASTLEIGSIIAYEKDGKVGLAETTGDPVNSSEGVGTVAARNEAGNSITISFDEIIGKYTGDFSLGKGKAFTFFGSDFGLILEIILFELFAAIGIAVLFIGNSYIKRGVALFVQKGDAKPVAETPKKEEPKQEPKAEEPKAEEPKQEEVKEEPKAEEKKEEPAPAPAPEPRPAPAPAPVPQPDPTPVLEAQADSEEEEDAVEVEEQEDGTIVQNVVRYDRSFYVKIAQSVDDVKEWYTVLKNELLSYKGVTSTLAWTRETFKRGKEQVARIVMRGKTLCVALQLGVEDYEHTTYEGVEPTTDGMSLCRIRTARRVDYVRELIAQAMHELGIERGPASEQDWYIPYNGDAYFLRENLVKRKVVASRPVPSRSETAATTDKPTAEKKATANKSTAAKSGATKAATAKSGTTKATATKTSTAKSSATKSTAAKTDTTKSASAKKPSSTSKK